MTTTIIYSDFGPLKYPALPRDILYSESMPTGNLHT